MSSASADPRRRRAALAARRGVGAIAQEARSSATGRRRGRGVADHPFSRASVRDAGLLVGLERPSGRGGRHAARRMVRRGPHSARWGTTVASTYAGFSVDEKSLYVAPQCFRPTRHSAWLRHRLALLLSGASISMRAGELEWSARVRRPRPEPGECRSTSRYSAGITDVQLTLAFRAVPSSKAAVPGQMLTQELRRRRPWKPGVYHYDVQHHRLALLRPGELPRGLPGGRPRR